MPNPTSPGEDNPVDASFKPPFTGELPDPSSKTQFGSGVGGLQSPFDTSKALSETQIGNYISGKSFAGSDGKV